MNTLLTKIADLARKLAIDLSESLVSAKLLIPLEESFLMLDGKTQYFNAGIDMICHNESPVIILWGNRILGVPMPAHDWAD